MGKDALQELMNRHPKLFRDQEPAVRSHLPPGWLELTDRLCTDLETILGDAISEFVVQQVKEKWAGLRFYWSLRNRAATLEADLMGLRRTGASDDEPGDVGFTRRIQNTPAGVRISITPDDALSKSIAARVREAEEESQATCQMCGRPGNLWIEDRGGYGVYQTACIEHREPGALTESEWTERLQAKWAAKEGGDER